MARGHDEGTEKYACDTCRSSKVACSREASGCKRCRGKGAQCVYSRTGVIRRRKLKNMARNGGRVTTQVPGVTRGESCVQCHLATDIELAHQQLSGIGTPGYHASVNALSSLSETCATSSIQCRPSELDARVKKYFAFPEHAAEWARVFERAIGEAAPLLGAAPRDVMSHLEAARPNRVRESAWLVMYFAISLNTVTTPSLKEKLQTNLWLALSDVRVLLDPSEINISALVLTLSQASDLTGPSLCWMIASSACRMLQALGVSHSRLDPLIQERRRMMFWHLNLLDKGLAVIFGRSPTFHRQMVKEVGLPVLGELQPARPHRTSTGATGVFGAHYMYQNVLLSHRMHDVWDCLHAEENPTESRIKAVSEDLASWYGQAQKVLEAAALSEKPMCDEKNAKSIDVALSTLDFHFLYLAVLLTRSSIHMREQCLDYSKRLLRLLEKLAPESKEPYHPFIWQLVCCPFTPFLVLFCSVLSNGPDNLREREENLAAMEVLPGYLKHMSPRNPLAAKLKEIASILVRQASSVVGRPFHAGEDPEVPPAHGSTSPTEGMSCDRASDLRLPHFGPLGNNFAPFLPTETQLDHGDMGAGLDEHFAMFMNNFDTGGSFDWLSWDH